MSTALPPMPGDSNYAGPGPQTSQTDPSQSSSPSSSPFGGGLPAIMTAMKQIEMGYQTLAQSLPSLAPLAADAITKLRTALPQAAGAGAGPQSGGQPSPQGQGGPPGLQSPPLPQQG